MAKNLATSLQKFNTQIGKGVNRGKKGVDKILYGSVYNAPAPAPAPGTANQPPKPTKVGSFLQSGLYNCLDALNSVDICGILNFIYNVNTKIPQKRSETPTKAEQALYDLQDQATNVRLAIDSFYAFPNEVLNSLREPNQQGAPAPGTTIETNTPPPQQLAGSAMQKYNFGIVNAYISSVFKYNQILIGTVAGGTEIVQEGLLDPEVQAALKIIPGFNTNLLAVRDYLATIDKYGDFRQIPNEEFQKLLGKLDTLRGICVAIEGFSIANAVNLADSFLSTDIRSEIAKLNQYLDPKKLTKVLSGINDALRSFDKTCRTVITYLRLGRGIIKIALVLIKVFKFIRKIVSSIPAPLQFATYSMVAKLEEAKEKAKETETQLEKFLAQINMLLSILIGVVVYFQQNTATLLQKLEQLLAKIQGCPSLEGSDIVKQMQSTQQQLVILQNELTQIITDYNERANPDSIEFQDYTIRIVEEELVDEGITNRRRRGIALDNRGVIAVQSDLTFATLNAIIFEETKIKLISAGLAKPEFTELDLVILEAQAYLGNEVVNMSDLNVPVTTLSPQLIRSYIGDTVGTTKARKRVRSSLARASANVRQAIRNTTG